LFGPFLHCLAFGSEIGMLFTVYFARNHSSSGILLGLWSSVSVQSCSARKKGMLLTGLCLSMAAHRLMNSRHDLSQLAWVLTSHDMQWSLPLFLHALVWCFSPQVPHVSSVSKHLSAKCPQCLHFMHWAGSTFCFVSLTMLPQM
jgi:hypothetical protein